MGTTAKLFRDFLHKPLFFIYYFITLFFLSVSGAFVCCASSFVSYTLKGLFKRGYESLRLKTAYFLANSKCSCYCFLFEMIS